MFAFYGIGPTEMIIVAGITLFCGTILIVLVAAAVKILQSKRDD